MADNEKKTANFILQESETQGTQNFTLQNLDSWRSFNNEFEIGVDRFYYFIKHIEKHEMEVGVGYLADSSTLVRETILDSTNNDEKENFSDGIKEVTNKLPASVQNRIAQGIDIFNNSDLEGSTHKLNFGSAFAASTEDDKIFIELVSGTGGGGSSLLIKENGDDVGIPDALDMSNRLEVTNEGDGTYRIDATESGIAHDDLDGINAYNHHVPPTLISIAGVLADADIKTAGDDYTWKVEDGTNNLQLYNSTRDEPAFTVTEESLVVKDMELDQVDGGTINNPVTDIKPQHSFTSGIEPSVLPSGTMTINPTDSKIWIGQADNTPYEVNIAEQSSLDSHTSDTTNPHDSSFDNLIDTPSDKEGNALSVPTVSDDESELQYVKREDLFDSDNLVPNSSFETWAEGNSMPDYWTYTGSFDADSEVTRETNITFNGNISLRINDLVGSYSRGIYSDRFDVPHSGNLSIEGYSYIPEPETVTGDEQIRVGYTIYFYNENGDLLAEDFAKGAWIVNFNEWVGATTNYNIPYGSTEAELEIDAYEEGFDSSVEPSVIYDFIHTYVDVGRIPRSILDLNDVYPTILSGNEGRLLKVVSGTEDWYLDYTNLNETTNNVLEGNDGLNLNPLASVPTQREGEIWYDEDEDTYRMWTQREGVDLRFGRDTSFRARNTSGSSISKGQCVTIKDSSGNNPTFELAQADSSSSSNVVAITMEDIGNNQTGNLLTHGRLFGLDTSSYTEGDILYLSNTEAGGLTSSVVEPYTVIMGQVIRSDSSEGQIYVNVDRVWDYHKDQTDNPHDTSLENLIDTDMSDVEDGQAPVFNVNTGQYEPGSSGGASSLGELLDVTTSGIEDGQGIVYDSGTQSFSPGDVGGGGTVSGDVKYSTEITIDSGTLNTTQTINHGLGTTQLFKSVWRETTESGVWNEVTGIDEVEVDEATPDDIDLVFGDTGKFRVDLTTGEGGGGSAENTSTVQELGTISGTTDVDVSQGTQIRATLGNDTTFTFSGSPDPGNTLDFDLRLTDADQYAITWPSGTLFAGSVAPDIIGSLCEIPCQIKSNGTVTVYRVIDDIG